MGEEPKGRSQKGGRRPFPKPPSDLQSDTMGVDLGPTRVSRLLMDLVAGALDIKIDIQIAPYVIW